MVSKRRGFLWEDERDYIDAMTGNPRASRDVPEWNEDDEIITLPNEVERRTVKAEKVNWPSKMSSRIRKDIGTAEDLSKTIREFNDDLRRVEGFYCEIEAQPGGRYNWRDNVLSGAKEDIRQLRDFLDGWLTVAEKKEAEWVRGELHGAIDPIRGGLNDLRKVEQGKLSSDEYDKAVRKDPAAHQGLVADLEEVEERRKALAALLRDEGLFEIFEFIADTPGNVQERPLKDRSKGKNNWKWWASKELGSKYGLVEKPANGWGYRLTDRGTVVQKTWHSIMTSDLIEGYGRTGGPSKPEAALHYLSSHFDDEEW